MRPRVPHHSLIFISSLHRSSIRLVSRCYHRPSFAPKPVLNIKHIRENPGLYEQNCIDRNYEQYSRNGWQILELHGQLVKQQQEASRLRQRSNAIGKDVGRRAGSSNAGQADGGSGMGTLLEEAKWLKTQLAGFDAREKELQEEMERLAIALPNLSSLHTPVGHEPKVVEYINERREHIASNTSHVEIGKRLDILDFEGSATTSGWGWYFLRNEGVFLEQALIQYAMSVAIGRGWKAATPPSLVYAHIANACGFMPRDQNGETQIYNIANQSESVSADKPSLVLAGTAEIPFAGSKANSTIAASELPFGYVGPSRCYRAEAGARGVDTKGLYRVHEFTKVEMFGWTMPDTIMTGGDRFGDDEENSMQAEGLFSQMLEVQKEILQRLGLHARVLEMPTTDLGASATRKVDIEAFFPSRRAIDDGYGEVTSASMCTDYQSRRLGTRLKLSGAGKLSWPYTVNGTALAVPRVLACILENYWDEASQTLTIPEVLREYMPGNQATVVPR